MIIELLISIFLGILIGVITGLIPGLHINIIGTGLFYILNKISFSGNFLYLAIFVISLSVSNIFLEFIPSIFLSCPDTENHLSILPGHELLKKGRGYEAVKLTSLGALNGTIILFFLFPLFYFVLNKIYPLVSEIMFFILIGVFLILLKQEKKKISSLFIFVLSGLLGLCTLNLEINEPLLPLFTGLFGVSNLIVSLKDKIKIPSQKITFPEIKPVRIILSSIFISPICGFLPGLGSGQSSLLTNLLAKTNREGFLFLNGITNILILGLSFISLSLISKTRTGSAVIISNLIGAPSFKLLILFFICAIITGIFSFFITDFLSRKFCVLIQKVNYQKISFYIILFLTCFVFLISEIKGILILLASTLLGVYCQSLDIKKTNLMGCLLIPTLIYYFLRMI